MLDLKGALRSFIFSLALSCHFGRAWEQNLLRATALPSWLWRIRGLLDVVLVEVVTFEECLDTVSSELRFTLLDSFCIFPLLIINMILIKIVHVYVRNILWSDSSFCESSPVKIFKPGMRFQLWCAIFVSNTVSCLALQALIDKVGSFLAPAMRYAELFYLNLSAQNCIPNVLPCLAFVRALSHHTLIGNDAHCEVICYQPVILPTHDLWGHIARCTACLAWVVRWEDARHPKICQSQVAIVVKDQVFRFDIPMDDLLRMDGLKCMHKASNEETRHLHTEFALVSDVVPQVPSKQQVHHQVQIHSVLKCKMHIDNELTLDLWD